MILRYRRGAYPICALLILCAVPRAFSQAKPVVVYPDRAKFLFWSPQEKPVGFSNIEKIFPGHIVKRAPQISPLPYAAKDLDLHYQYKGQRWDTERFIETNNVAGLLVIHDGEILLERYALG